MTRVLTDAERIEARHWLQVLSERARQVRDAMDPRHGILRITDESWARQWDALCDDLDGFTVRVLAGETSATASPGPLQDRNG